MSTDLPFLDAYGGQTTHVLIALESEYRIDSLVLAFEAALDAKAEHSKPERVVLAVDAIEQASYEVDDDEARLEQFNALDSEYYAGEEPIDVKLFEYIKRNRQHISL